MQKQPPWEIRIGKKAKVLAEFSIPAHKMQKHDLAAFLKAVVVRNRTDALQEMVPFYVNKRRGNPARLNFAEVRDCHDLDRNRIGYWCGDWDCYAFAMQEMPAHLFAFVRREVERNKSAARGS